MNEVDSWPYIAGTAAISSPVANLRRQRQLRFQGWSVAQKAGSIAGVGASGEEPMLKSNCCTFMCTCKRLRHPFLGEEVVYQFECRSLEIWIHTAGSGSAMIRHGSGGTNHLLRWVMGAISRGTTSRMMAFPLAHDESGQGLRVPKGPSIREIPAIAWLHMTSAGRPSIYLPTCCCFDPMYMEFVVGSNLDHG